MPSTDVFALRTVIEKNRQMAQVAQSGGNVVAAANYMKQVRAAEKELTNSVVGVQAWDAIPRGENLGVPPKPVVTASPDAIRAAILRKEKDLAIATQRRQPREIAQCQQALAILRQKLATAEANINMQTPKGMLRPPVPLNRQVAATQAAPLRRPAAGLNPKQAHAQIIILEDRLKTIKRKRGRHKGRHHRHAVQLRLNEMDRQIRVLEAAIANLKQRIARNDNPGSIVAAAKGVDQQIQTLESYANSVDEDPSVRMEEGGGRITMRAGQINPQADDLYQRYNPIPTAPVGAQAIASPQAVEAANSTAPDASGADTLVLPEEPWYKRYMLPIALGVAGVAAVVYTSKPHKGDKHHKTGDHRSERAAERAERSAA
jgi:hypothetical protein